MTSFKPLATLIVSSFLAFGLGCSDDTNDQNNGTPATNTNTGTTTGSTFTGPNTSTTTGSTTCVPRTVCEASACGMVDDGCGGRVDCGQCECESGAFTGSDPECGPCGLGIRSCAGDAKEAGCSLNSLEAYGLPKDPEEVVCQASLVFVEAAPIPGGDGTKANPYASYAQAMALVNVGQVVVLSNKEEFTESLTLQSGIHVLGGYTRMGERWSRDESLPTPIRVPWVGGKDQVGVWAKDLSDMTRLEGIDLKMGDAPSSPTSPVHHSIGVWAQNTKGLQISGSLIASGRPEAGLQGKDGAKGSDGGDGGDGENGGLYRPVDNGNLRQPLRGKGGVQTGCEAAGGLGGLPGAEAGAGGHPPYPGQDGENVRGGAGGGPGTTVSIPAPDGSNGLDGPSAREAEAGLAQGTWTLKGDVLVWTYEGDGKDGEDGEDGGGGGGGGGQAGYMQYIGYDDFSWGPSGSGGGAGGCGGKGGGLGKAGGSSFGIVLYDSVLTLTGTKVQAALGGQGGAGGEGGKGGEGGRPGDPGLSTERRVWNGSKYVAAMVPSQLVARAGKGGEGGDGSDGASGSGGAGGASVAVYCASSASQLVKDDASELVTDGAASGGNSQGSDPGPFGLSSPSQGCQ